MTTIASLLLAFAAPLAPAAPPGASLSMKRSNASTYSTGRIAVWSYMATRMPRVRVAQWQRGGKPKNKNQQARGGARKTI